MKSSGMHGPVKRRSWRAGAGGLLLAALAGCAPAPPAADDPAASSGWTGAAHIVSVRAGAGQVTITADAAPRARVVLSDLAGDPIAASADGEGRIVFRLAQPATARLFAMETRDEAHGAATVERVLVLPGGQAAVLTPGGAARVAGPGLTALDYDGGDLIASGGAAPGRRVSVSLTGQPAVSVVSDSAGRFVAPLGQAAPGEARVTVDGRTTSVTLSRPAGGTLVVQPAGPGRAVIWPLPGGGAQWTWIADAG